MIAMMSLLLIGFRSIIHRQPGGHGGICDTWNAPWRTVTADLQEVVYQREQYGELGSHSNLVFNT
jgi:hypothetical protein